MPFLDLTGQRFGRLTVLSFVGLDRRGKRLWSSRCDCGGSAVSRAGALRRGVSRSCGCLRREALAAGAARRHAAAGPPRKRVSQGRKGEYATPERMAWEDMQRRCTNPQRRDYHRYGGRGIRVCERWTGSDGYAAFLADMGRKPRRGYSLERRNVDGNYEPANCCWATAREQQRNRRNNHRVTLGNETRCLVEWCERLGMKLATVCARIQRGWDGARALTTPVAPTGRKAA